MRTFAVILSLVLFTHVSAQVSSSVDTTAIRIGEEITYTIHVDADSIPHAVFPDGQTFIPLEVIDSYPMDTLEERGRYRLIKNYGLTQFDSGRYVIPRQHVAVNEQVFFTDSVSIEVTDVVVDTTEQQMFDIRELIAQPPPKRNWGFWPWVLLALLIGAAVFFLIRHRKKIIEAKKQQLPPYEEAMASLQTLDQSDYLENNRLKDYYSSLTEIAKHYLDREVDESALESTTDELIEKLRLYRDSGKFDFDEETITFLEEILHRADLVKFAKMTPESSQTQADRDAVQNIIEQTHRAIPEPTEAEWLQDELYRQEQEKKKKRKKRLYIAVAAVAFVALVFVVSTSVFGFSTVRDTLFGNTAKKLLEGEWVKSEYGSPAIILKTPDVLVRLDSAATQPPVPLLTDADVFTFGEVQKELFVLAGTTPSPPGTEIDLENILEEYLQLMERDGATNMIVNEEPFETEKGVVGVRARGEFNVQVGKNRYKKDKSEFELLIFGQDNALQELLIVYEKGNTYARDIKERILNSVELEVTK